MNNIYNAIQNVYNMDKTTWQEVLAELYNLVANVENKFDLFELKFGSLLGEQVTRELKKMYDDGSLASLINDKLLKDINTKVDTFKTELTELNEQLGNKANKENVDSINTRINNLILPTGNTDLEVQDARHSVVQNKTYLTLTDRINSSEEDIFFPIKNLLKNGDFKNGSANWNPIGNHNTITITDNLKFNGNALAYAGYQQDIQIVNASKIAICFNFKNEGSEKPFLWLSDYNSNNNFIGLDYNLGNNIIITDNKNGGVRLFFRQMQGKVYNNAIFDNVMIIPLISNLEDITVDELNEILETFKNRYFEDVGNMYKFMLKKIINNIEKDNSNVDNDKNNYTDKKVLVIGDSISSDTYGNYKKWVTNLIDEGFFSSDNVTNSSHHATGFVATTSGSTNFIDRIKNIADKSSYDLVIIFGGINDFIQDIPLGTKEGDKTTQFKPAVDYFFEFVVNNFTQARIVVLSPLKTYRIYPNNADNKQEVYMDYIKEVSKKYCLPLLNLSDESGFCPFNESFKQRWTLVPVGYGADGVHPNEEYEKEHLTPMIKNFLLKFI